jgi:methionyl-tRNA formyltransferase
MATIPLDNSYLSDIKTEFKGLDKYIDSLAGISGKPGEIVSLFKNFGPVIQTGNGLLLLSEIQLSGKRQQSGWDLVNGTHLKIGEVLV